MTNLSVALILSLSLHSFGFVVWEYGSLATSPLSPRAGSIEIEVLAAEEPPEPKTVNKTSPVQIKRVLKKKLQSTKKSPGSAAKNQSTNMLAPYPPLSRLRGEEGLVVVKAEFDGTGDYRRSVILSSSGFRRLDLAAIRALRSLKKPDLKNQAQVFNFNYKLQ